MILHYESEIGHKTARPNPPVRPAVVIFRIDPKHSRREGHFPATRSAALRDHAAVVPYLVVLRVIFGEGIHVVELCPQVRTHRE